MISSITKETWNKLRPPHNPFLSFEFFDALRASGCVGPEAGWLPVFAVNENEDAALFSYVKSHSYGEFIFDWGWAEAYARYRVPYYPKFTSMVPFTPVTTGHFLMKEFDQERARGLLKKYEATALGPDFSSSHFLFLEEREISLFESEGYFIRESVQFHFVNPGYGHFDEFLSGLKSRKAKQIRSERAFDEVTIKRFTGPDLTDEHARQMFQFYLSTIELKHSQDYLNEAFFTKIFQTLKAHILYVEASRAGAPVAGSLFFFDQEKLYGRYWGSTEYVQNLHFELCYYQGIDFCIEQKIKIFEAGAQGQHKIARGFRPTTIFSAHKINHPEFREAIGQFIKAEVTQTRAAILEYSKSLPFKEQKE